MDRRNKQLASVHDLVREIGEKIDLDACVRLWDGSRVPLGQSVSSDLEIVISSPGVIASILRRPTLDRLIQHYAHGQIDLTGGSIVDLGSQLGHGANRKRLKGLRKSKIAKALLPFLLERPDPPGATRGFGGDEGGEARKTEDNRDYIQFHYDVGNAFYDLFLDPQMQYSCAYFEEWGNTLEQAQLSKLDMICRKLRLKPGDKLLDIGCGWGGLVCHAAEHFGVEAYGVTLSEEQIARSQERIASRKLGDRVTVELRDYTTLTPEFNGAFNKISSIGMYEHIGIANIPTYFATVQKLLATDGIFLNHAISRRAKKKKSRFRGRAEQRALQKYIFPGGELDDIGHTIQAMEQRGFEVCDVEAWRTHYARTCHLWCERLMARRDEAEALVGAQTYRIWIAYLGGCSLAFSRGTARIYQTVATKSAKGPSPLPPTRSDLYT